MDNYNSSNYYRANPYKNIGYMPPIAQKNRDKLVYGGQIPQGREYFEHATKKHYGQAYRNEIVDDNIMKAPDQYTPLQKQAMQRSYFRSLNSKDIQGSTTNTLISKAVKNKQKAQLELQRRKQIQRQQAEFLRIQKLEQEQSRKKYLQQFHRQVMMNRAQQAQQLQQNNRIPHSSSQQPIRRAPQSISEDNEYDQRKKREAQLLRLAQQRKNYAIVDFSSLYNNGNQNRGNINNGSLIVENKLNYHMQQKRRKTQRDNQAYYASKQKQNQEKAYKNSYDGRNQYQNRQRNPYSKENNYQKYQKNRQIHQKNDKNGPINEYRGQGNQYNQIQRDEMRKYQNYSLPYQNLQPITQIKREQRNFQRQKYINPYGNQERAQDIDRYRNIKYQPGQYGRRDSKITQNLTNSQTQYQPPIANYEAINSEGARVLPFKSRQQLRRHNPTYLSYESPTSFAIAASKNVIGGY